jgi:hypothetical protein
MFKWQSICHQSIVISIAITSLTRSPLSSTPPTLPSSFHYFYTLSQQSISPNTTITYLTSPLAFNTNNASVTSPLFSTPPPT